METAIKGAERYYDDCQVLYNLFWPGGGMHYGFWEKGTRRLSDAVENQNRFVFGLLDLKENDHVLDAGCGVGGSSFSLARGSGVRVTGITISSRQIRHARKRAKELRLDRLVNFELMDFSKTGFKDNTFTKILCNESVCYAPRKTEFLREAYRVLKPGGRIAVADGFLTKKALSNRERVIYNKWLNGWKVPNLSLKEDFLGSLREAGFRHARFHDKTEEVLPSSRRIAIYGYIGFPAIYVLSRLKMVPENFHEHVVAMMNQQKILRNFAAYGVFVAEK